LGCFIRASYVVDRYFLVLSRQKGQDLYRNGTPLRQSEAAISKFEILPIANFFCLSWPRKRNEKRRLPLISTTIHNLCDVKATGNMRRPSLPPTTKRKLLFHTYAVITTLLVFDFCLNAHWITSFGITDEYQRIAKTAGEPEGWLGSTPAHHHNVSTQSSINQQLSTSFIKSVSKDADRRDDTALRTAPEESSPETRTSIAVATGEKLLQIKEKSSTPACSDKEVVNGRWLQTWAENPPYISSHRHLRCYPDSYYEQSPFPSWEWQPYSSECSWTQWNQTEFCDLVPRGTISIIGDSLSWEQYSSLLQLLGQSVRQRHQHWSKSRNKNHVQMACRQKTRIVFRNDPYLRHVGDSIHQDFPQIIVLNRGAHFVDDAELVEGMQLSILAIQAWQAKCKQLELPCLLIWRTSVPGHPQCAALNFTTPINDRDVMESLISDRRNYDNHTINYHWYDFQRQNRLVLSLLDKVDNFKYTALDGYAINVLRPDDHRSHTGDCLHNCYPGKMDIYNQWLLHILKRERTGWDIKRMPELFDRYVHKTSLSNRNLNGNTTQASARST
jgi:hypothetical protein